jgi:hypothetical protein
LSRVVSIWTTSHRSQSHATHVRAHTSLPIEYPQSSPTAVTALCNLSHVRITRLTAPPISCRNRCRNSVGTWINPSNEEPSKVRRQYKYIHETQFPRNPNFPQCKGLPLSSRSVLISSCTWGCSHKRSASSRPIGGKGLRGKPP